MKKYIFGPNRGNNEKNGVVDATIAFSEKVLDEFRDTVGRFPAETGGMLACSKEMNYVDCWHFDEKSKNTGTSYSYDVDEMSEVFRNWKQNGIRSVGFVHSHPQYYKRPSYEDVATAHALMKFFGNDFFCLPIIMSNRKGLYTMLFFVVRKQKNCLNVHLDYVLRATEKGYQRIPFKSWEENYSVQEMEMYYKRANGEPEKNPKQKEVISDKPKMVKKETALEKQMPTVSECFQRMEGVYPSQVLDKVQVIVGVGGARTIAENLARNGFRNFVLIDGDRIAPSNIATQGVFLSEMGRYKTEAIRDRILDIHPEAKVVCVNRFLDERVSDEEFWAVLQNHFPGRKPTDFLLYGCTDSFEANKRTSLLSLKYGTLYIGAGMYQGGLGAEVIFLYPGVTASCPRCLLRPRFEANEKGYQNDVTSKGCTTFATERLNTLIGFVALMLLMYKEDPVSPYNRMLEKVKDRNFVWLRLSPYLNSALDIPLFDRVFAEPSVAKYTFMDESLWVPQHPDAPKFGERRCKLCGGVEDLTLLQNKWEDTRKVLAS